MWVYWDKNSGLTEQVIQRYKPTDHRWKDDITCVGYCFINNALYPIPESSICHFPKVTTLKEIDEIRLMYSLGLTEKDM